MRKTYKDFMKHDAFLDETIQQYQKLELKWSIHQQVDWQKTKRPLKGFLKFL